MRAAQTLILTIGLVGALAASASPFATGVVRAAGAFGGGVYGDPNSVLGAPAPKFRDTLSGASHRVKLVEPAYNVAPTNSGLFTTNLLLTLGAGSEIIVRFDQPIVDDPAHPYGLDLLVFGNSFYLPNQFVSDTTDMGACVLNAMIASEPLKVSVSPGFSGQSGEIANDPATWPWYRYDNGPFADSVFPTQAYKWNRATTNWSDELMDFTKPVNPAMQTRFSAGGLTAADGIDLYDDAGGGTGFDLHESGFAWIQYVKVEGIDSDFTDGEVDAFAAVRSMTLGDTLSLTPENILSNTATLMFQKPGAENENIVTLAFTEIGDIAQVSTAPLNDLNSFAALPGVALTVVQLELSPILGFVPVAFTANLELTTGTNYSGNGRDLLVFQSNTTNWNLHSFSYNAATHQALLAGVTNLSAFAVVQFTAPTLQLSVTGSVGSLVFTPVGGLIHTLERSTNLVNWTSLNSFTASNALPATITDNSAPTGKAFYRLRLEQP